MVPGGSNHADQVLGERTLKIEGKADQTAERFTIYLPNILTVNKTSLHQRLEKLSENRINNYTI